MDIEPVSKATANFLFDQCAGTYSGHMANVANNPVLFGLVSAHAPESYRNSCDAMEKRAFADFLRQAAKHLDDDRL